MDTGSGNIWENGEIKNVTGNLVEWRVGEEVIIKECKFKVTEVRTFPDNEIRLLGIPRKFGDAFDK